MPLITLTTLLLMLGLQSPDSQVVDLPAKPIPVAVLCNGDDGLTARLCDEAKRVFSKSPDFTLEVAHKPRILIVRIPTNVQWKKIGGRIKVLYRLEFSLKDNHDLRGNGGSCWEDTLKVCAAQIISEARSTIGLAP